MKERRIYARPSSVYLPDVTSGCFLYLSSARVLSTSWCFLYSDIVKLTSVVRNRTIPSHHSVLSVCR